MKRSDMIKIMKETCDATITYEDYGELYGVEVNIDFDYILKKMEEAGMLPPCGCGEGGPQVIGKKCKVSYHVNKWD